MLRLDNQTPFDAAILPGLDKEGIDTVTVAVKGTFAIDRKGAVVIADAQLPLQRGDTHYAEPGTSSVLLEDETSPLKRGTDVVLVGHAWAGGGRKAPSVDVSLRVGRLARSARVFGDRAWYRGASGVAISEPVPFARMPLVWERAFGGKDAASDAADLRNPVGVGYTSASEAERIEGVRLPNMEDPESPIASPADRPAPVGFGYVGRHWLPRSSFAGTYDDAWRTARAPLLPLDFDDRFFNGAPLVSPKHLEGGEPVQVVGASETGELRFQLPTSAPDVTIHLRGEARDLAVKLDTVVIHPDERRLVLVWRATEPCPRSFVQIDWVRVRERGAR
ncbi:MAG: DUF2169 domain-containing protein [Polyangiaceae bacterium]